MLYPTAKQVELSGFVLTKVIPTHKHRGTLIYAPEKVPGVSSPTFEWDGLFIYCGCPAILWIQLVYSVQGRVLDLLPLSVLPDSVSSQLAGIREPVAS
jgi:hypothetical protein